MFEIGASSWFYYKEKIRDVQLK